ncbi:MAG: hypothetical protein ABIK45_07250 [Pseudomonadota bacterium]
MALWLRFLLPLGGRLRVLLNGLLGLLPELHGGLGRRLLNRGGAQVDQADLTAAEQPLDLRLVLGQESLLHNDLPQLQYGVVADHPGYRGAGEMGPLMGREQVHLRYDFVAHGIYCNRKEAGRSSQRIAEKKDPHRKKFHELFERNGISPHLES